MEWLRNGDVLAVLDDRIMAEYVEVPARPVFRLPLAEVELVLAAIRARSFWIEAAAIHLTHELPDPDNAPFLECARTADVPLVTGNLRHFPKTIVGNVKVLTPAQFIAALESKAS